MKKIKILTISILFLTTLSSNAQMVAAKVATDLSKENKKEVVIKKENKKALKGFNFNKSNKKLKKESCSSSNAKKSCCSKEKTTTCSSSKKATCSSDSKKEVCCSSKKVEKCTSSSIPKPPVKSKLEK